jgi:hypothetical protein
MKSNRNLLKEAIADAKAVKETAIANAKAALEENFGPLIREKLAAKIAEMDEMEENEELEEAEVQEEDGMMGESDYMMEDDDMMGVDETMDEIDLEELLRELDGLEEEESIMEGDELMNDPKGSTAHGNVNEDEDYEDEDADGIEDDEDAEVDIENMDENDLRKFIEKVIASMIDSGELEGNVEGEEEEVEFEDDDEMMNEANLFKAIGQKVKGALKGAQIDTYLKDTLKMSDAEVKAAMDQINAGEFTDDALKQKLQAELNNIYLYLAKAYDSSQAGTMTKQLKAALVGGKATPNRFKSGGNVNTGFTEAKKAKAELNEALKTINTLRSELNEINLLNAKLLYVNKIFRAKNLTEAQKVKVLEAFDKTSTPKEAKLVFETLSEGLKEKRSNINESMIGGASKVAGIAPKKPILEVDNQFARWQVLAGIK